MLADTTRPRGEAVAHAPLSAAVRQPGRQIFHETGKGAADHRRAANGCAKMASATGCKEVQARSPRLQDREPAVGPCNRTPASRIASELKALGADYDYYHVRHLIADGALPAEMINNTPATFGSGKADEKNLLEGLLLSLELDERAAEAVE